MFLLPLSVIFAKRAAVCVTVTEAIGISEGFDYHLATVAMGVAGAVQRSTVMVRGPPLTGRLM